jgi:hypothetical protein
MTGQRAPDPVSRAEIDLATLDMVLDDLTIDIVNHLEVNGAAVRVPEETITLKDEVQPHHLQEMEIQVREKSLNGPGFGEICFSLYLLLMLHATSLSLNA